MPSDSNGVYSLPAGYLAVTGDPILASQHNPPLEDIAESMTNRLMRSGAAAMTGPLKADPGSVSAPGYTFNGSASTGFYKTASGLGVAVGGVLVSEFTSAGVSLANDAVTYAKMQNVAASKLIGNPTAGSTDPSEVSLGAGLAFSGTSLVSSARIRPQGRLTLTSGAPVLAAEVSAATSVYYSPYEGDLISIYDGTNFVLTTFTELTLALNAAHTAGSIYDVFVINDDGTIRLVTGPAWTTLTAGAGARGAGAGTTELERKNGLWTNKVSMTARYGATTTSVAANCGTYVGSIYMDGTNGQISCHLTYGQSRKWGVWNAYNRVPILLKAGDGTASWTYSTNTIRASNNDSANKITVFTGLPECFYDATFIQSTNNSYSNNTSTTTIGIGVNSTSAYSGMQGANASSSSTAGNNTMDLTASYRGVAMTIGINALQCLEKTTAHASTETYNGTETNMLLSVRYEG